MENSPHRLDYLFDGFLKDTLSETEKREFLELLSDHPQEAVIKDLITRELDRVDAGQTRMDHLLSDQKASDVMARILQGQSVSLKTPLANQAIMAPLAQDQFEIAGTAPVRSLKSKKLAWMAAAGILIFLAASLYIYFSKDPKRVGAELATADRRFDYDVAPGRSNAILTLSDGTRINLDSAADGKITQQGNTRVIKMNGQLAYKHQGGLSDEMYNTIATSRGNQYQLILPDGSKVWLNAESSVTFPTSFTGQQREIKVAGEAYFEVAKMKNMPFIVSFAGNGRIEVLGTHFNISTYADEPSIKTTLVEGKIRVSKNGHASLLSPGEQARVADDVMEIVKDADVDAETAWKNGFFSFKDADVKTIMRQLARWYNIDITYEGVPRKERFSGDIDRTLSLVSVLKILEKTKVNFKTEENNRLVIMP